ncbi:MAG: FtsX-like permease family protein [Acidobacteria bacterium]|nr:MAG: FtsX-like permease family protein [Acidobacteriota bacterium]
MKVSEVFKFAAKSLTGHRLRTGLSLLGVTIGVAAVVMLTALGEGARLYVVEQFASLGTNLLIVLPGYTETSGTFGYGGVPNDLTLDDAQAIARLVPAARRVAPISMANDEVAFHERRRQVAVLGTTPEYQEARQLDMARGEFLPADDVDRGSPVVILGAKTSKELFGSVEPVGKIVRVAGWRMRVIGVLAKQGTKMGLDFDDIAIVPVATAMQLFNQTSLFRILVQAHAYSDLDIAKTEVRQLLIERHDEEDITVITQDAVLSTFNAVLGALTLAVGAIAAISLSVAGIGIMNVMLVSVSERTQEIGLLKALGVARRQILAAFLTEAALISSAGGLLGLVLGWLAVRLLVRLYPVLPASPPIWAVVAALVISVGVGVTFGLLPARRATRLDPIAALAGR